jgi:alkylation response protein AidB-like acyl-CoA dehydrogenase
VSERALEITSGYVREREQFGVPIGSFQAVQHRSADGFIDLAAMRWTTWRAAWKLSEGLPAERETAVAKFWAADGGSRIANSAQHLHGGIGVDLDYPIHRYFVWSKALELTLGGATAHLVRLGRDMAQSGPQELT